MSNLMRGVVVTPGSVDYNQAAVKLALFNTDGDPLNVPELAAAQTDAPALTQAAITGGDAPTETEFNTLRTDLSNTRSTLNSLLAKLRTAGIIAP